MVEGEKWSLYSRDRVEAPETRIPPLHLVCDDGADEVRGRDIERRIEHLDAIWSHLRARSAQRMRQLPGAALLDDNTVPCGGGAVRGGEGGRHEEGHSVMEGSYSQGVGADLVGSIAIGCDSVSSHHDSVHFTRGQQRSRGGICNECGGDAVVH